MKISVICVYNNEESFNSQLLYTLKKQKIDYELIAIDNRNHRFPSAAAALNYGARKSKGDVLIFSHQDIYLKTGNELEKLAEVISKEPIGTIVGTQGVREKSKIYYSNLTAGKQLDEKLNYEFKNQLYEVACVDEGLFGMKRDTYDNHNFDEKLCNNWHLYCVEQCLYARKHGAKVYVFPSQIHHYSYGTITYLYMDNLRRICRKYRKEFKYIWTTCYKVKTNPIYINVLVFIWVLNRKIRRRSIN
nr:glycosyltransferase [uncultured Anaerostipes sp.]